MRCRLARREPAAEAPAPERPLVELADRVDAVEAAGRDEGLEQGGQLRPVDVHARLRSNAGPGVAGHDGPPLPGRDARRQAVPGGIVRAEFPLVEVALGDALDAADHRGLDVQEIRVHGQVADHGVLRQQGQP